MPYADLVFTGGPVFTANTVRSRAGSVAVKDGRIVAVSPGDLGDLVGPSTEIVDVQGRMPRLSRRSSCGRSGSRSRRRA